MSSSGITPDPDRVSALSKFPVPTDQTSVRSFLGFCNKLAFFVPDYQHHTVSLRQLTGKGRSFIWLPEHQVEFDTLKSILSGNLVVRHFNKDKPVFSALVTPWVISNRTIRERKCSRLSSADQRDSLQLSSDIQLLNWNAWLLFGLC